MYAIWSSPQPKHPWMDRALCREVDPELFFPHGKGSVTRTMAAEARGVCFDCPVRHECLEYALADPHIEGVWGGTTDQQRREMRRERRTA